MRLIILCLIVIALMSCARPPAEPTGLVTENAMVVSAREEASAVGIAILKMGGNAFDAMIG